jgi:hypothetical protein
MFATIRRYDAVDQERTGELVKKADETLVPSLKELPGFNGYYLIENALPNAPKITTGEVVVQKTGELVQV